MLSSQLIRELDSTRTRKRSESMNLDSLLSFHRFTCCLLCSYGSSAPTQSTLSLLEPVRRSCTSSSSTSQHRLVLVRTTSTPLKERARSTNPSRAFAEADPRTRFTMGLWSRTYVCCAVPLYNAGIYAILSQFLIVSIVTGVLCFAAPSIVSVTTPSFCSYILGILCILVAVAQPIGFLGVYRERPKLFKTYSRFNGLLVACALLLALALIIISAAKHSTAVDSCTRLFSADDADTSADSICNIWTWIQIGIMGLLFVIVALCELYFLMYESIYASEQKLDHARYNSVYSAAAEEVRASGLWDGAAGRLSYSDDPSAPPHGGPYYGHGRTGSKASGLRNEIARGETQEELDQMAVYGGGGGGGGGKLKKSKLGQSASGPGPVNASSVVGYRDDEEAIGYDYGGRGGGGGRGGYDDYPQEGGFRPPGQSSEVPTRRW